MAEDALATSAALVDDVIRRSSRSGPDPLTAAKRLQYEGHLRRQEAADVLLKPAWVAAEMAV
jgi:hypothetical protein